MRFKGRPVGTIEGRRIDRAEEGCLDVGDTVTLTTGEELMVTAVGTVTFQLRSLNGCGVALLTSDELDELVPKVGVDAASGVR